MDYCSELVCMRMMKNQWSSTSVCVRIQVTNQNLKMKKICIKIIIGKRCHFWLLLSYSESIFHSQPWPPPPKVILCWNLENTHCDRIFFSPKTNLKIFQTTSQFLKITKNSSFQNKWAKRFLFRNARNIVKWEF